MYREQIESESESTVENVKELRTSEKELSKEIEKIQKRLSKLENDKVIKELLVGIKEKKEKELKEVKKEIKEQIDKLNEIANELLENKEQNKNELDSLTALESIGEDIEEGFEILSERDSTIDNCLEKIAEVASEYLKLEQQLFVKNPKKNTIFNDNGSKYKLDDNGNIHMFFNGEQWELYPETEYTRCGYHYKTDSMGRITDAWGTLKLDNSERNGLNAKLYGMLDGDQRGHTFASIFAGSDDIDNLTPQFGTINQGQYKSMELQWKSALEEGKEIKVMIEHKYINDSRRPYETTAVYQIGDDLFESDYLNVPDHLKGAAKDILEKIK